EHYTQGRTAGKVRCRPPVAARLATCGLTGQTCRLRLVAELLGHTTTRMTERYAHASPEHRLALGQRISRVQRDEPTGTRTGTGRLHSVPRGTQRREDRERPRRDSNPRYRRERPVS